MPADMGLPFKFYIYFVCCCILKTSNVRKWETSSILLSFQLITTACNVIQARVGVNSIPE